MKLVEKKESTKTTNIPKGVIATVALSSKAGQSRFKDKKRTANTTNNKRQGNELMGDKQHRTERNMSLRKETPKEHK